MSEADGVDGGAFRKRGLTHLQWAEKPEAPEAERHLEGMSPFFRTRMIGKTLTRVTAGTRVGVSGASLSPTEDCVLIFEISKYRHDRSCLEMSEADGVDGGAFRKRGLTHLQWAEKPEAPEAERHLEGMSPFFRTRMIGKTLTRVTAGTRVGVSGASLSPTEDCVLIFEISKYRHDRSCLEMSEADGVDGGAFRKRGLTHLQWAEKPEAPEAERHLEGMSPFFRTRMIGKTLTRVTAGTRVGVSGASLSPTEDCVLIFEISKYRHDRSCLEMSEADGVDGGAFRKRGLTHLQWAEKPEAPEAERHLEGMSPFFRTRMIGKTLTRVTAGTRVGVSGASLSPTEDCVLIFEISKYRHDRSCLEMSEADGVDGGAFRKRGLTHLQWAEKPEAPEAERHLGTRD
ncbi:hypothetical protein V1478_016378 [Vespula squamosa]|uniref:Uncharacterized protein n=1 Tax=Vespula squamosa TaxID=30214 RepID=A0ABD1ZZL1_VESSQ